ncbi:MAG: alpha-glucan family phosphorylase [Desulfobulbaceae bacterium]|nr:alpha-glucan family phosphorylase [Desulfobulbaceae bacterium]MDY0352130.1 alpha-glucan family phosphorylase [Desulfobulbaceae bacterium]
MKDQRTIAYFSMEIGLDARMPTYSGGLGVLAGDTIRSAADLKVPMVAVTLLYRRGYFHQRLDPGGWQREEAVEWTPDDFLREEEQRVTVVLEGRTVRLRSWRYDVQGVSGYTVPVYFLDADLPENTGPDRTLTHFLYGGDQYYRLCQEALLGIGGVRMLRALGYEDVERFHMNEGHSSLLTLELLDEAAEMAGRTAVVRADAETVREKCVFTTHTPVPAGHDQFPLDLARRIIGERPDFFGLQDIFFYEGRLNLTYLALSLSRYVNGVAKKHGEVSRLMFAGYSIDAITNGIHAATWTAKPFRELFDRYMPGWKEDNFSLRYALNIPREEVWQAHLTARELLFEEVRRRTDVALDWQVFTIGFARRSTEYKRGDLLFSDIGRLKRIASENGGLQIIYSGKAHPRDKGGKELIQRIFQAKKELREDVRVVYVENYDMAFGRLITGGVDLWLNTPLPPLEASGTSGMKAALNGVPSLSVLDGWWIEGHIEGVTGWSIGGNMHKTDDGDERAKDALSLYDKLENIILPLFYHDRDRFIDVMRSCVALNGAFFNTQRMMLQYVLRAYL